MATRQSGNISTDTSRLGSNCKNNVYRTMPDFAAKYTESWLVHVPVVRGYVSVISKWIAGVVPTYL